MKTRVAFTRKLGHLWQACVEKGAYSAYAHDEQRSVAISKARRNLQTEIATDADESRCPIWIPVTLRIPTKKDADRHERVWAIVHDSHRPFPTEVYWKHVVSHAKRQKKAGQSILYSHWAVPPVKNWKYPEEK